MPPHERSMRSKTTVTPHARNLCRIRAGARTARATKQATHEKGEEQLGARRRQEKLDQSSHYETMTRSSLRAWARQTAEQQPPGVTEPAQAGDQDDDDALGFAKLLERFDQTLTTHDQQVTGCCAGPIRCSRSAASTPGSTIM